MYHNPEEDDDLFAFNKSQEIEVKNVYHNPDEDADINAFNDSRDNGDLEYFDNFKVQ